MNVCESSRIPEETTFDEFKSFLRRSGSLKSVCGSVTEGTLRGNRKSSRRISAVCAVAEEFLGEV